MEEQNSIEQMTVLMVEPGYEPYEKTIPNTLAAKQELVGGLITAIYPYEEMVAIVANDEGILLGMDFNRSVEDDFCSLPPDQIERFKKKFHKAELLLGVRGNDLITLKVEPKQKDLKPEKQRRPPTQER